MQDIFDKLVSQQGLYEKIFGKLLNDLVYAQDIEKRKALLKEVFGFRDVDFLFPKEIERGEFENLSKIIFKYQEKTYVQPQAENQGFFSKKD